MQHPGFRVSGRHRSGAHRNAGDAARQAHEEHSRPLLLKGWACHLAGLDGRLVRAGLLVHFRGPRHVRLRTRPAPAPAPAPAITRAAARVVSSSFRNRRQI